MYLGMQVNMLFVWIMVETSRTCPQELEIHTIKHANIAQCQRRQVYLLLFRIPVMTNMPYTAYACMDAAPSLAMASWHEEGRREPRLMTCVRLCMVPVGLMISCAYVCNAFTMHLQMTLQHACMSCMPSAIAIYHEQRCNADDIYHQQ